MRRSITHMPKKHIMVEERGPKEYGMEDILHDVGLSHCIELFQQEKVTPDQVPHLTELDLQGLGITTIGDRLRLKDRCREIMSGIKSTLVAERLKLFQSKRRKKGLKSAPNTCKSSRRIQVGWKHRPQRSGLYRQITKNKGGGIVLLDIDKTETLINMEKKISETFFPDGFNEAQNIKIKNVDWFLANFNGLKIELTSADLEPILVSTFLEGINTSPVRIYLHTQPKSLDWTFSDDDFEPSTQQSSSTSSFRQVSVLSVSPDSKHSPEATIEPLFEDADTPTVQFRQQKSLSLKQEHLQRSRNSEGQCQPQVIEIIDSEDEELQRALFESLDPSKKNDPDIQTNLVPSHDIQDILKKFQQETVTERTVTKLLVLCSNILDTALKGLDRKAFDFKSSLYIKFSGELGEDQGGPRREFFRLVMKALKDSKFFDGNETQRIFSHSLSLLEKGHYRLVGQLVALSLAHDGPGLHFLSSDLYDVMVGKNTQLKEVENLLPEDTNCMIQQLKEANSSSKEDAFLMNFGDQLLDLGITGVYRMAREDKETLVDMIKKHYIYYRISGEISQFTSGMNEVNKAWDMVTSHADLFKPIFCYKPKEIVGDDMLRLFKINYSEPGSNDRNLENISIFGWETFLQSIEAGQVEVTFSEVLVFVTGADSIPPCGFSKLIDVDFYTCEGRLPSSSTCALQLWLPRVADSDLVSTMMIRAIKESYGFMKV